MAALQLELFDRKYNEERPILQYAVDLETQLQKTVNFHMSRALWCGDNWREYVKDCVDEGSWMAYLKHTNKHHLITEYVTFEDYGNDCKECIDIRSVFFARFERNIEDEILAEREN